MPVVSVTRLRVRSWRFLPGFLWYAFRSSREATNAEGNIAAQVLNDRHRTFWTATIWTTEAAMKNFMLTGAHREAMRKLLDWCDEASLVHWTQESSELPTWSEAHRRLHSEGRRSKVNHPSSAHVAYEIPEPHTRRSFRLK
ncbi:MAG TPA: DUF3291 domain-containing protein [Candidatus Acidoferrales bacterium]|nr:DUF3291 domain-containing protein [Candidatus Acidoferrales bacterium]